MGIPGVYKQIGPGERIALSKLAVEHLETTGRPLRIAIDVSIWQFQIQSGQGGKNPALRTLYYRLLRLLALPIQPLFVFDGPNRPAFKRNVKINPYAANLDTYLIKQLLKPFGFPFHNAPGEAEAECALLQKEGIVDAVLSEDVDTMMFGCALTLKNWTAEGRRGNKTPTHVNVFTAEDTKSGPAGLDSEGMILIALMSGGDYITAGIPGCGPKTAAEAARAGFGRDLCRLSRCDADGLRSWRERLERELHTNESKHFGRKHKAISIPDSFPDKTVFGYYTHPVVSPPEKVARMRTEIAWDADVNVLDLRQFVSEAFGWSYITGAKHFIRGLAPALLVKKLVRESAIIHEEDLTLEDKAEIEARLVKVVSDKRAHWITDGAPELRIAYVPADIVGLDLDAEERDDYRGMDDEASGAEEADSGSESTRRSKSPTKKPSMYDPTQIEKIWVLETHVKLGVPLLVETWEEDMRNPRKFATRKAREKTTLARVKGGMKPGALDQFVKIRKPGVEPMHAKKVNKPATDVVALPPVFLAPTTLLAPGSPFRKTLAENTSLLGNKTKSLKADEYDKPKKLSRPKKPNPKSIASPISSPSSNKTNPWTLSRRPSDTFGVKSPTRYSALGIYAPGDPETLDTLKANPPKNSNPPALASPPSTPSMKKHDRSTSLPSDTARSSSPRPTCPKVAASTHHAPCATSLATPPKEGPDCKPSPRKKRSPLPSSESDLCSSYQLKTPTSTAHTGNHLSTFNDDPIPLSEAVTLRRKANRRLQFSTSPKPLTATSRPPSPLSEPESLPSPSMLMMTSRAAAGEEAAMGMASLPASPSRGTTAKRNGRRRTAGKVVAVRESLEGAWKTFEKWEVGDGGGKRRIFRSVEVVDLAD